MRIHWVRIVLTAAAVEAVLLVIAIPLNMSATGQRALLALVIPLCALGAFLGAWWAARKVGRLYVLHGLLVGAVAALIYGGLTLKITLPGAYIVANYLKLVGGAAGGLVAQLRSRDKPKPAPH
jgi:hypothetical protein